MEEQNNNMSPRAAPGPPSILRGEEIKRLELIDPPSDNPTYLKATSYDLTLGPEVFICGQSKPVLINLEKTNEKTITIESFGTIIFSTKEKIKLGKWTNIVGHFGLRIAHGLDGLMLQVGPQIEPGYDGPLFGALLNTRGEEKVLHLGDRFLTVEFCRIGKPASNTKFKHQVIHDLHEFLCAQHIRYDQLIRPSVIECVKRTLEDCRSQHVLRSRIEDSSMFREAVKWTRRAVYIAIILFLINYADCISELKTKLSVKPVSINRTIDDDSRRAQQSGNTMQISKVPDSNVINIKKEPVLKDKPVTESNGFELEQKEAADANVRNIGKDHNEP